MIAILEKYEHNVDFHQIVDFIEASHIRYALTINPTVNVSHIRQFWSTARIETTDEGTKILATLDDHHAKILKYQAQQSKPLSKKKQREFYMSVLRSHSGWKTKHFRDMTLEEIREKFIPVWKQIEDFVHMALKEEGERVKRKGLRLEQGNAKKMKTSEERNYWKIIRLGGHTTVYQFFIDMLKHFDREDLNQLWTLGRIVRNKMLKSSPMPVKKIPLPEYFPTASEERLGGHTTVYQFFIDMLKHFDREDLNQLWTLVKETLSIRQASSDKEKELWVELKRIFEPDFEEQLRTHTQALMHDPLE
nr:hypothetical protein [Tanacetum cinerariifolium]